MFSSVARSSPIVHSAPSLLLIVGLHFVVTSSIRSTKADCNNSRVISAPRNPSRKESCNVLGYILIIPVCLCAYSDLISIVKKTKS